MSVAGYWDAQLTECSRRIEELGAATQAFDGTRPELLLLDGQLEALLREQGLAAGKAGSEQPHGNGAATPDVSMRALCAKVVQLCSYASLGEDGRPHALPDPDMERLRGLMASNQHEEAVEAYLQLDLPSLRWDSAPVSTASLGPFVTAEAGGPRASPQDLRTQLHSWAAKKLSDLHRDASPAYVHQQLLKAAARDRSLLRFKPEWWRLALPRDDLPRSVRLASAVYHLAGSRDAAWAALQRCLWHGMAQSSTPSRMDLMEFQAGSDDYWSPYSLESRKVDLEQAHTEMVERAAKAVMSAAAVAGHSEPPRDGGSAAKAQAKLQEEMMTLLAAMTPVTYLQMVGQKLLFHAATQLPVLATLPDSIQPSLIRALYTLPFAKAVRMAMEAVCEDPEGLDPTPFAAKAADEVVKKWRVLQSAPGADKGGFGDNGDGKGASKSSIKTILNVVKGITKDVADFELGLLTILDQVPEVLRGTAAGAQGASLPPHADDAAAATWPLRATGLRTLVRGEMEAAVLAHRGTLGTLLVSSMTRTVRAMLASPGAGAGVAAGGKGHVVGGRGGVVHEEVNAEIWPKPDVMASASATAAAGGVVREEAAAAAAHELLDDQKPRYVDGTSFQVLQFVSSTIYRMPTFPDLVVELLTVSLLECLTLLMDHLGASCAPLHALGLSQPCRPQHAVRLLLLHHGAAACVRRRMLCFRFALDLPTHDEYYEAMVKGYANTLLQAEELVSALSQQLVSVHASACNLLVLPSLDRVDWRAVRRPLKRARAASAAPRSWRCCLARLLHGLVQVSSPDFSSWVMGQVLQEGLAAAALRYSQLSPSPQLLPHFVADVIHVTSTAFMYTQRLVLPTLGEETKANGRGHATRNDSLQCMDTNTSDTRDQQQQQQQQQQQHGHPPHDSSPPAVEVAAAVSRAVSDACLALCTRAALLVCGPPELQDALPPPPEPPLSMPLPPTQPAGPLAAGTGGAQPARRDPGLHAPSPPFPAQAPSAPASSSAPSHSPSSGLAAHPVHSPSSNLVATPSSALDSASSLASGSTALDGTARSRHSARPQLPSVSSSGAGPSTPGKPRLPAIPGRTSMAGTDDRSSRLVQSSLSGAGGEARGAGSGSALEAAGAWQETVSEPGSGPGSGRKAASESAGGSVVPIREEGHSNSGTGEGAAVNAARAGLGEQAADSSDGGIAGKAEGNVGTANGHAAAPGPVAESTEAGEGGEDAPQQQASASGGAAATAAATPVVSPFASPQVQQHQPQGGTGSVATAAPAALPVATQQQQQQQQQPRQPPPQPPQLQQQQHRQRPEPQQQQQPRASPSPCGSHSSAPWSWLPRQIKSALRAAADEILTEQQLVNGFDPFKHMDVSNEEPYPLSLAVDRAEAAAATKAMAAIARERGARAADGSVGKKGLLGSMKGGIGLSVKLSTGGAAAAAAAATPRPSSNGPGPATPRSRAPSAQGSAAGDAAAPDEALPAPPMSELAAAWCGLMASLVAQAPHGAALSALALRHELHDRVVGLPYSDLELYERELIQQLAEQHSLLHAAN